MKLPDFSNFLPLNELRSSMGAKLILWSANREWSSFDPNEWRRLQREGLDVPIEEVIPATDLSLEYRGEKVILYIRDQQTNIKYYGTSGTGYRFHVADCQTLINMRDMGRYDRYVVTRKMDGKFIVNLINYGDLVEKEVEIELKVCKNCLKALNYKKYNSKSYPEKDTIWKKFNIMEYFEQYDSKIKKLPRHDPQSAPINIYPDNIKEISDLYRERVNWKCEECLLDFKIFKKFLHLHHIDGNKSNNNPSNLQALCLGCHAEKDGHSHLRNLPEWPLFISYKTLGKFAK